MKEKPWLKMELNFLMKRDLGENGGNCWDKVAWLCKRAKTKEMNRWGGELRKMWVKWKMLCRLAFPIFNFIGCNIFILCVQEWSVGCVSTQDYNNGIKIYYQENQTLKFDKPIQSKIFLFRFSFWFQCFILSLYINFE